MYIWISLSMHVKKSTIIVEEREEDDDNDDVNDPDDLSLHGRYPIVHW